MANNPDQNRTGDIKRLTTSTFEEFRQAVYRSYKNSLKVQNQDEVESFFKSAEAEIEMQNTFKDLTAKLENGIIEESVILTGGAGGCAQCLVLMF